MQYLKKKEKLICFIILGIIAIGIYYYINTKNKNILTTQEENLEVQENISDDIANDEEKIKVHISGAVNEEGVVELDINSRIVDAIEKAGGVKENACMDEINLAYKLEDGMKVHIPTIEEKKEEEQNNEQKNQNEGYITGNTDINNNNENKQNSKVNINTCTQTELETLPGIGPVTALKIIEYRNEKGKFKSIEEIKEVSGIGESKFNQIKDLIKV